MLVQIGILVTLLSLLAFGGANAIVPELHRQVVDVMGRMTDSEFTNLFALAQTAPGPNVMILSLVGWRLAGAAGLAVATAATVDADVGAGVGRRTISYRAPATAARSRPSEQGWCRSQSALSWRAVTCSPARPTGTR